LRYKEISSGAPKPDATTPTIGGVEERFCCLEVDRAETLGEAVVDWLEER
jgi:hypothetical protein